MRALLAGVTAAAMLVSGCGGPETEISTGQSAQDVAIAMGCRGFKADAQADLQVLVTSSGECRIKGKKVAVYYFNEKTAREQWTTAGDYFGKAFGAKTVELLGDYFAVVGDEDSLDIAKRRIGGDVSSSGS